MNKPLITCILALGLTASIPATITAQSGQRLRFEIPSGQTTTGTTSDNATSTVAVTVGGIGTTTVSPPKGASSKDVVDSLVDALKRDGYKVTRDGDHGFFVEEGPLGKPIDNGGGIGGTDTGIQGVKVRIDPPANPNAKPGAKKNGGQIPLPVPKQATSRASKSGSIQVDAEVERIENGKPVRIHVQVVVPINPGDSADDIEKRARAALEAKGLMPRDVSVPSNLDGRTLTKAFGIDRTANGDPVFELRYDALLPSEFRWLTECWIGTTPPLGTTDEGTGSMPREPWLYGGDPFLGMPFPLFVEVGPQNVLGGLFLGSQRMELPLPSFGPDAYMFVDPFSSIFFPLPLPQNGRMQVQLPLPPDPQLAGIDLMFQAMVLDVPRVQFATTNRLVVHPMQRR
ncbi:MAG: hypothetical protein H6832_13180 [Planctomycetes bacterium]|nr:hypothetical protein [Planctomycetota bacterium]